jgi:RimJ/RimL family protein N-acetyltransferase
MTKVEGEQVLLRTIGRADYLAIHGWYNDPDLVAPFDRYAPETYDDFVRSVESAEGDPASLAPRFAIEERSSGALVGAVGHYWAHPVLEYIDVWYLVGNPAVRGRGYGRESVGLLVDHLFRSQSVERIGACIDLENLPSTRLVLGLGFRQEGTLRSALFHHGRWHDVGLFGVTRPEWSSRRPPGATQPG